MIGIDATISRYQYDLELDVCYCDLTFLGIQGYRVGDDGSVWTRWKREPFGQGYGTRSYIGGEWVKRKLPNNGKHISISMSGGGKHVDYSVHRLVLEAFCGPCPDGMECCHFPDRDPTNNRLSNLRWATHIVNEQHKRIHGTSVGNRGNIKGEANGSAKLTEAEVVQIRELFATGKYTMSALKEKFGVKVNRIIKGTNWKHVGGPIDTTNHRKTKRND